MDNGVKGQGVKVISSQLGGEFMEVDDNKTEGEPLTLSSTRSTEVSLMSVRAKKAGLDAKRKGLL